LLATNAIKKYPIAHNVKKIKYFFCLFISFPLNFRVKKPLKNNGLQGEFCSLQPLCNSVHHSSCPFLIELIPFFKVPIDIVASTANSNQPESLGATRAVQIIAAAQRIDCVMIIFAILIISFNYSHSIVAGGLPEIS
ncbi:hypothetical protein N9338_09510, partial [Luminiphilus sp.]|nr:hypothetical protein [Luminiphilus sp.]